MHTGGHVLLVICNLSFVGISADNKINAIYHVFEMPIFSVSHLSGVEIMEAIGATLSKDAGFSRQSECIRLSEMNFSYLADVLNSKIRLRPDSIHRE